MMHGQKNIKLICICNLGNSVITVTRQWVVQPENPYLFPTDSRLSVLAPNSAHPPKQKGPGGPFLHACMT